MGLRRRVHHRTQLHAFAQKGASGESSGRHDQGRRPHSPSRRLRGTTTILRVHLPKALEVPQSIARLNAGKPPTDSSDEAKVMTSSALSWSLIASTILLVSPAKENPTSYEYTRARSRFSGSKPRSL